MTRLLFAATAAFTALAAPALASPVVAQSTNVGEVLAAANTGMTVYTFTQDAPNESNCYDSCASAWPPFIAAAGAQQSGGFGLITRRDGSQQWALNGQPLYFWQGDAARGDATGHGVGGVWFAATN